LYEDGAVVPDYDEYDGITYYYQCRDGEWFEIMGLRPLPVRPPRLGTLAGGVLSLR
jgi:hypothetical protein